MDESVIRAHRVRKAFSPKHGFRPVIIMLPPMTRTGASVVYPRTTSGRRTTTGSIFHRAHIHNLRKSSCNINRDGWVVVTVPYTVLEAHLTARNFSCSEPQSSNLVADLLTVLTK